MTLANACKKRAFFILRDWIPEFSRKVLASPICLSVEEVVVRVPNGVFYSFFMIGWPIFQGMFGLLDWVLICMSREEVAICSDHEVL
jgi:hypothetical protein